MHGEWKEEGGAREEMMSRGVRYLNKSRSIEDLSFVSEKSYSCILDSRQPLHGFLYGARTRCTHHSFHLPVAKQSKAKQEEHTSKKTVSSSTTEEVRGKML